MTAERYPLYCVDRGDRVGEDWQYAGPFATHETAVERSDAPTDMIRRCRQLRPSEIAFERDANSLAEYDDIDALIDALDEAACSGNLTEGAWHRSNEYIVAAKYDPSALPTHLNYDTWVNDHLTLEAYICEGDE